MIITVTNLSLVLGNRKERRVDIMATFSTAAKGDGPEEMSIDEKVHLITRNLDEVVGEDRLREILATRDLKVRRQ